VGGVSLLMFAKCEGKQAKAQKGPPKTRGTEDRNNPEVRGARHGEEGGQWQAALASSFAEAEAAAAAAAAMELVGSPLQIIQTGDAEVNYKFTLVEENLRSVLEKVPPGMHVSVVSVVGAFRTGKSFLLSLLLRFLRSEAGEGVDWVRAGGDSILDGNANLGEVDEQHSHSFEWRGGEKRMTTGIWMWSEPFVREIENDRKVAVLLVDTQGMFDNETSMALTACIFGLTTLISSHLVYNVEKRIQEDHLQQLALFSEYGRMALAHDAEKGADGEGGAPRERPFQQLEFLVRDWQNFDDDDDISKMRRGMDDYLKEVIRDRGIADLRDTREQITSCFEKISCFGLCHPGSRVTKKTYNGSVDDIEDLFLQLVDAFARQLFDDMLEPKRIHGRQLTAPELLTYVITYVELFRDGAKFPEAKTMLEATASANNSNAKLVGLRTYKDAMDVICGPKSRGHTKSDDFKAIHEAAQHAALAQFDKMATMGREVAIVSCRSQLMTQIAEEHIRYQEERIFSCGCMCESISQSLTLSLSLSLSLSLLLKYR
jgi:atlastin